MISACEKGGVWELAMWILYAMSKWQASSQQSDGGCLATDKNNSTSETKYLLTEKLYFE